ncbi:MAG: hypothetical protein ACI8R4_001797 [Paracoccaceae bacterium]|jgi:hypothetical protein
MTQPRILRFYLHDELHQLAADGQHNFINKIAHVVKQAGYRVEYRRDTPSEHAKSAQRPGYAIFLMDDPTNDRGLTIRKAYHYPFWSIERSPKRWEWPVAVAEFPANDVPRKEADRFYKFWQRRLFDNAPTQTTRDGLVYVPLQGRLLDHRSFQSCAPLDMLRAILDHDKSRQVIAALHPNERYSPEELAALDQLNQAHNRLTVQLGGMERLLKACDYVVTQNSGAAFNGYLFGKPAVLFGQIDFHHIAANVADLGVAEAVRQGPDLAPDYAGYVHWFWQTMSINAGRDTAEEKIAAALKRGGWPL